MSLENIKCNFTDVNLAAGGAKVVLDLARVLFAEIGATSSKVYVDQGAPELLIIEGDFRNIVAGAGAAGMDNGPLFGSFTNVDEGDFVSNVVVNFDAVNRVNAAGKWYFTTFGSIAAFDAYTLLESIVDVLGGMGHSIQDVGLFKMNQTGNAVTPPVQAAAATATTGGTVPDGPHFLKITALDASGETVGSNEVNITTAGGGLSTITANWAASVGASGGYNVYIGSSAGAESSYFHVATGILTKVITALPGTAGTVPVTNTAGLPNTQEVVNVKNTVHQTVSGADWSTLFLDGNSVLYIESILDLVGA